MGDILGKLGELVFELLSIFLFFAGLVAWWFAGAETAIVLLLAAIYVLLSIRMK